MWRGTIDVMMGLVREFLYEYIVWGGHLEYSEIKLI
jgi:hypothetical protein